MGYGHDERVNIRVEQDFEKVYYVAKRDIDAEEELLVSYGEDYWSTRPYNIF